MSKNKHFYFFLLSLIFFNWSFSQEKIPLKKILIAIEKQHKVKFNYIDEAVAKFRLVPPQSSLLLSQKLDYLTSETQLEFENINPTYISVSEKKAQEKPIVISDKVPAIILSEVAIDRYLTTGIAKKPDGTFVIKPKKMGLLPGLVETDILQTMQQIPGIISVDETISNINIRGGTHDQNLFLWNGIRMFQTGHFFGLISAFNPNLNDKISISKNGTSAFYGESVSGLINIESDLSTAEQYNSGISSNLIAAEFHSKIKISTSTKIQVSGRRSLTDFFRSPTYKNYYNRIFQNTVVTNLQDNQTVDYTTDESFYFYDFTMQMQHKINQQNELQCAVIGIKNALIFDQSKTSNDIITSKNSTLNQQNWGGSGSWSTVWNQNNKSKIGGYVSNYQLDSENQSVESNQILNQKNSVLDIGLRLENQHQINANLSFKNGYQYNEIGIRNNDAINNPAFSRKIKEVLRSHALVLETSWVTKNQKMVWTSGLRANYFEAFHQFIIEPRIQWRYQVSNEINIALLGEQKSQTIEQIIDLQQDFLGVEKRRWTLSDDASRPIQRSSQIELDFTFKSKNWLFTFDNYYKKVDGISSTSQSFQNQLEFQKIKGNYTVLGSELLIQRNFNHFYTWLNYTLSNNNYNFEGFTPSRFPNNFEITQTAACAAIYEYHNLKIALGTQFLSGRPTTTPINEIAPTTNEIEYNSPNNSDLSSGFQTNLSASYRWHFEDCEMTTSFSFLNLFNNKNTINRYYRLNDSQIIESVNTYALGCTPNLSIRLNF